MLAAIIAVAALGWSCADFDSPEDITGGAPDELVEHPSFSHDIQPIFTARCSQGGCHTMASAQLGVVLEPGHSYDSLVNHIAVLDGSFVRVKPGDHENSWLWRMLQEDDVLREHNPRMPLAASPLTPNQLQTIVNWIEDGAPDN